MFTAKARNAATTRMKTVTVLAPLTAILAAVALGVGAQPASADLIHDTTIECGGHLWSPDWNIDDTDPRIKYSENWKAEVPAQGQFHGTQHVTKYGGARADYTLPRSSLNFALGFTKMRSGGIAAIYFNNVLLGEIDMYAPSNVYDCALIWDWGLPPGKFTIKAVNRKNPASDGTYVNVDYIHNND